MALTFYHAFILPWIHVVRLAPSNAESSPQYLGCFLNEILNISNHINVTPVPLSDTTCSSKCLSSNYTYAALNGSVCRCTNNYYSKLMKVLDDDCNNVSCSADTSNTTCQTHYKMFKTQHTSEESYPEAIYLGCYFEKEGDDTNRLLKYFHEDDPNNTPQQCSEKCFKTGFLYSGTTYGIKLKGSACWCGNQYPSNRFKTIDSKCDHHCPNDTTKFCGGSWKMSFYSTGIVDYPLGNSIGCFKRNKNVGSYYKKAYDIKQYSDAKRCFYICNERGYKYAAISEVNCECSNEPPSEDDKKTPDECNKCEKDETEYCGSISSISVYENKCLGEASGTLFINHFGCFKTSRMYPVIDGWNVLFPRGLTSRICASNCHARGFPYAALVSWEDDVCTCSFDCPPLEARADDVCGGACGTADRAECSHHRVVVDVFTTGLRTACRSAGDAYLGCYGGTGGGAGGVVVAADEPGVPNGTVASVVRRAHNTPRSCSVYCDAGGHEYYGLADGDACWCGGQEAAETVMKSRTRVDDETCSARCSGDANRYCGGVAKTALFRIGMIADVLQNCFESCDCHYFPKRNVSSINCSKRNLKDLNKTTSVSEITTSPVELYLNGNSIRVQPNLTLNFNNVILLDLSNNSITRVDADLLPKNLKVLRIGNNNLTHLEDNTVLRLLETLDRLSLSNNPWSCGCYLKTFLKHTAKIEDVNSITCSSSNLRLVDMNENDYCKNAQTVHFPVYIVSGCVLFFCVLYFNVHKIVWLYLCNVQCRSCWVNRVETEDPNMGNPSVAFMQRIQYEELESATDNWDRNRIIGKGGFGTVYKANWKHTEVAIKRLKSEEDAEKVVSIHVVGNEILPPTNPPKEIIYLNAIKHDNVLAMYGFCFHLTGSCLIYQYMANGSLEDRLQRKNGTKPLSWPTRGNIAVGTARGLQFLHNIKIPLIHGDIKSANILLDANFEPRIGDFGLARTGPLKEEANKNVGFAVSHVCGTRPYLPDDFCKNKKLSTKVDTYSFGMVMFEIATGLRAFDRNKSHKYLKELVNKHHDKSTWSEIAEKNAGQDTFHVFETLIQLGKLCVVEKADDRPEMVVVYTRLQNAMKSSTATNTDIPAQRTVEANSTKTSMYVDSIKLRRIKAALAAPLHDIPSITALYSDEIRENDPRKITSAKEKFVSDEISDEGFLTTDKKYCSN